ncbi:hypothetical protein TVAG_239440 [Trichomonas vaginalis G3]|uniref:COG complex component COG2 C-terminal domain-containing protein n=1 Tax=Trichomonas vaginalis (strain ATCC PRA-98 / G3) TaxID=412133 RepID=A2DGH3_TRIV3|nr:conserved oligomeric Golgi complex component 2 family [Trichomonas vaginalis G3]EAY20569.1 hypothetical protein TVAG_239440 [Trichomonas vaginalis G3]KAI5488236.1 conserved oligomeric Golgi complex component 2 family [Trichomonas vaginalis G3]|eukprot:XP_001581555.1 hypothetical protein [Trichomonas vaginalis G3]
MSSLVDMLTNKDGVINFIYENSLNHFDFILNSVWPIVSEYIVSNTKATSTSTKEMHSIYVQTQKLFREIRNLCRNQHSFDQSINEQNIYGKLNLQFYPQLLLAEIAPEIEKIKNSNPVLISGEFKVSTSYQLFEIIKRLFGDEYYIENEIKEIVIIAMKICLVYKEICQRTTTFKTHFAFDISTFVTKLREVMPKECENPINLIESSLLETKIQREDETLKEILQKTDANLFWILNLPERIIESHIHKSKLPSASSVLVDSIFKIDNDWINLGTFTSLVYDGIMQIITQKMINLVKSVPKKVEFANRRIEDSENKNEKEKMDPKQVEEELKHLLLDYLHMIALEATRKLNINATENQTYQEIYKYLN